MLAREIAAFALCFIHAHRRLAKAKAQTKVDALLSARVFIELQGVPGA